MGKILLEMQQVELYPSETLYPEASLACGSMAKPAANQEHRGVTALRANIKALLDEHGMSYRDLSKAAHGSDSLGRTINNLVNGENHARVDLVAIASDGLKAELWQLFVPSLSELDGVERAQLRDLVDAFASGHPSQRQFLIAALTMVKDVPVPQPSSQRHPKS